MSRRRLLNDHLWRLELDALLLTCQLTMHASYDENGNDGHEEAAAKRCYEPRLLLLYNFLILLCR